MQVRQGRQTRRGSASRRRPLQKAQAADGGVNTDPAQSSPARGTSQAWAWPQTLNSAGKMTPRAQLTARSGGMASRGRRQLEGQRVTGLAKPSTLVQQPCGSNNRTAESSKWKATGREQGKGWGWEGCGAL